MDYSQLSDFDIQQEVLKVTWGSHPPRLLGRMMLDVMLYDFDPCNEPSDGFPLIKRHKISLESPIYAGEEDWCASYFDGENCIEYTDKNPLKAAMIVLLKMKDAKHV